MLHSPVSCSVSFSFSCASLSFCILVVDLSLAGKKHFHTSHNKASSFPRMAVLSFLSFLLLGVAHAKPHPHAQHRHRQGIAQRDVFARGTGARGLAYNSSSPPLSGFANTDITWCHDWNSAPSDSSTGFEFVPTLWSDQSPHSDNWDSLATGHSHLMSFNEPDITSQANMQVGAAIASYKTMMFPKRSPKVKIGAPSVSSGSGLNDAGIPMGTGWLSQFLQQCNDPNTCMA